MAVAKALKKTEAMATEHKDFPKWCQMTDPDDGSAPECKKVDMSPLRMLYPSVSMQRDRPSGLQGMPMTHTLARRAGI